MMMTTMTFRSVPDAPKASLLLLTLTCLGLMLLAGCAASGGNSDKLAEFQEEHASQARVDDINQQLLSMAVGTSVVDHAYRLGIGDEIDVEIFGVEELSRAYRIDSLGSINMTLIGEVAISGYTVSEAERVVAKAYAERYLRDPQVGIRITEYRSQQFTAIGAVASPRVYTTQRRITLLEALAMSGGLSATAGSQIYLTDRVREPESGEMRTRTLIISVDDLMRHTDEYNLLLGDSALVNVPRAGSIFVEGAVSRPGVYTRQGDTTVLKAITMAGGLSFEANRSRLRVLRRDPETLEWRQEEVNFSEIRNSPIADLTLNDGDIVMVEYGAFRTAWSGTMRTLRDIALLGWRPL